LTAGAGADDAGGAAAGVGGFSGAGAGACRAHATAARNPSAARRLAFATARSLYLKIGSWPASAVTPETVDYGKIVRTLPAMKRTLLTTIVAVLLLAATAGSASATEVGYGRKFGLGFVLGDPTGLTAKLWTGPTNALDFGLGFWGYGVNNPCFENQVCERWGYGSGTFHMDYLWQSNIVRSTAQLDWHVGAGGRAVWWGGPCNTGCFAAAARAPIGLDLMFNNPGFIEIFFEVAFAFYVVPGFGFGPEGGLGVRFYF
jgi:hypothetical protein